MDRGLFGWWYVAIALGFSLLALRSLLFGGRLWMTALRLALAAGFAYLGWREFRGRPK